METNNKRALLGLATDHALDEPIPATCAACEDGVIYCGEGTREWREPCERCTTSDFEGVTRLSEHCAECGRDVLGGRAVVARDERGDTAYLCGHEECARHFLTGSYDDRPLRAVSSIVRASFESHAAKGRAA